jgi:KaiC/GvpD/RAD55 family RecA-like ATPase
MTIMELAVSKIVNAINSHGNNSFTRMNKMNEEELSELIAKLGKVLENSNTELKPFSSTISGENELKNVERPDSTYKSTIRTMTTDTIFDKFFQTNGIPKVAQVGLVGLPDSGKSLLAQELALKISSREEKVIFVTSEDSFKAGNDRFDLQSRMRQKADVLKIEWTKVIDNLLVLDTISKSQLRDWNTFIVTYRYLVEVLEAKFLVLDSLTLLEDNRGAIKYRLLELVRYNQMHGVTAFYISQRATEDADKFGVPSVHADA